MTGFAKWLEDRCPDWRIPKKPDRPPSSLMANPRTGRRSLVKRKPDEAEGVPSKKMASP